MLEIMWDWSSEFRPNTLQHAVVLAVCFGGMIAWCIAGWVFLQRDDRDGFRLGSEGREYRLRRIVAWSIIATQTFIFVRRMVYFDLQDSLPLHLCRLGVWISAWMLWSLDRRARSLTLFWGIGLSAQIFFTPYLKEGYGSIAFWIYWLNHVQIVGAAVYDILVLGYRPTWKDLRFASIAGVVYSVIVIGLNAMLGTNYSYLGNGTHDGSSMVDKLGPYPVRTVWMILLSLVVFAAIFGISKGLAAVRVRVLKKPSVREIHA
ncbi:MAG: TIGR02206 family membrane protein [Phycisphaerales bacterium]|nr:TIGR02206 family membrane protein [Phycisphaerales bacterium]